MKKILVTQTSMPPYEEYIEEIKDIWESHWLTNMGPKHNMLESKLKDYLSKAKMVIINKYSTQQNCYCFSTKLGEYLAAAKPVVITNVGEAMNWLKNEESAYIVEAEDIEALADAIVSVFNHPDESRQIGIAGQEVCRQSFDYRNWSKPLVEFMNQLGK